MNEPGEKTADLASVATLHGRAAIVGTEPLTVRTAAKPWSYAVSFPLATPGPSDSVVVEAAVRVTEGCVGISCADEACSSLAGEVAVRQSAEIARLEIVPDAARAACLLVRTWEEARAAVVEIHSLRTRTLNGVELDEMSAVVPLRPVPNWSRYYGTAGESVAERVRVRDYVRLTAPVRREWIEGLSVVVQPGDQLSRALYVSGLYEPNTAVVLQRLLAPGATFLDVGAHAGVFTMLGSRYVGEAGRVFSFEPSPRERARLEEHVAINALTNVTIVPAAVGGRDGPATLTVAPPEYGGLNTLGSRFAYGGVEAMERVEVEVMTLDRFAARSGLHRIDVVKLDIEGAECSAMRGAARVLATHRPALVMEIVSSALEANGATIAELEELLKGAGYRIFRIDDETAGLQPAGDLARLNEQNIVALPVC